MRLRTVTGVQTCALPISRRGDLSDEQMAQLEGLAAARAAALASAAPTETEGDPFNE